MASALVRRAAVEQRVDPQVAVGRAVPADMNRFVRGAHVGRRGVGIAEDGDRAHAQLVTRADHPERDLTSIGDEDFARTPLQRDVPVLLRGVTITLGPERVERIDQTRPGFARIDDVINVAAAAAIYGCANFSRYSLILASIAARDPARRRSRGEQDLHDFLAHRR